MTRDTKILRFLLTLMLLGLLLASGLLYFLSLESAASWPELAHLRLPIYLAMVIGLLPVVVGIKLVFDLMWLVDRDQAFSIHTLHILGRLRGIIGVFAGYLALGLAGFWVVTGLMHPTLLFCWLAVEAAALFLFTLASMLKRLFSAAVEVRQDHELTV